MSLKEPHPHFFKMTNKKSGSFDGTVDRVKGPPISKKEKRKSHITSRLSKQNALAVPMGSAARKGSHSSNTSAAKVV
jgi:hypothetical protein